jgi:hypothetical protein
MLLAAAVLLVAGLAGAWFGSARERRAPPPSDLPPPHSTAAPKPRARLLPAAPNPPMVLPSVIPVTPSVPPPDAPRGPVSERGAGLGPKVATPASASELFARANLLRRQGRAGAAAEQYQLLLELYPSSREVGPTRLALGKHLQSTEPERALALYRAAAGGGGALRAEALWGISEIATSLGERAVSEQALADLLREFPDSPTPRSRGRERRMARTRAWRVAVLCLCGSSVLWAAARVARASPAPSASANDPAPLIARVEVAMLGDVRRDPVLFERLRSLFSPHTVVVLRADQLLDQAAVLRPPRADTVYIWIRVSERTQARVYLAIAEQGSQPRYLFREVPLESGLDEVGGETLAQVAHSSARALWLREQQSSRQSLVLALERDAPRVAPRVVAASPVVASPASATDSAASALSPTATAAEPQPLRLGVGASGATYRSGAEGWLSELGLLLTFEFRGRLSLRAAGRYLVPSSFELPPARVHLNGAAGELRAGWLSSDSTRARFRLEAGLGLLLGRARATIVDEQPEAHTSGAQGFERVYALAAAAFEWPIGPAWIAAGADLRVPLRTTSYEVSGQSGAAASASLCPGGAFEVGIGFDPAWR